MSSLAADIPSKRILDPAIGTGGLLFSVAAEHSENEELIGIDIDQEIIKTAEGKKTVYPKFKLINADFLMLNKGKLGFFDLIVCHPHFGQMFPEFIHFACPSSISNIGSVVASMDLAKVYNSSTGRTENDGTKKKFTLQLKPARFWKYCRKTLPKQT